MHAIDNFTERSQSLGFSIIFVADLQVQANFFYNTFLVKNSESIFNNTRYSIPSIVRYILINNSVMNENVEINFTNHTIKRGVKIIMTIMHHSYYHQFDPTNF